jgi:putative ABC transport system permease protein
VGRGAEATITASFEQMGSNVLWVQPRNPDAPGFAGISPAYAIYSLTLDDAEALADIPGVIGIAPTNENFTEVTFGNESTLPLMYGTTSPWLVSSNYTVARGEFITERDVSRRGTVVVLGDNVAKDLFGSADPLGEKVKIKGKRFTVIGVLESKGGAFMGVNMDDVVVIPITTYQTKLYSQKTPDGKDAVESIGVKLADSEVVGGVTLDIETVLRKRHHIDSDDKDDFAVVSQEQVVDMLQQVTGVFTIFLGAIAGISLLVGGIGIMNIMLVSVTERTREIGIRKAVGAKRRDILRQFLLEATMISLVGSGVGIAGGWVISRLASRIDIGGTTIPATVSSDIVILAISVAIFIGIVSGIYPALRAARLNPIDALHYR